MIVRDETLPPRVELSGSQRALLEERLQRARQFNGAKAAEPRAAIPRRPGDAVLPLSFAQERLWFLDQLEPGSAVYNMTQAIRMRGPLEVGALENALNEIVRRHEILRTNFVADEGEGRAIQVISPARTLPLPLVDLDATRTVPIEEELRRRLCDEARKPFDFARDLLVRALLVRVSPTDHTLMLTMHHIISDGWSIGVLFRELAALYGSFCRGETPALPELPLQFADFVLWERESLQGAALEERVLRLWCAKEAAAKCLGIGLQGEPAQFVVAHADARCENLQVEHPLGSVEVRVVSRHDAVVAVATPAAEQPRMRGYAE